VLVVLLSIVLSVLACSFVALRMLSLAGRTRKLPELCMGLGLSAFALAQLSRLVLGGLGDRLDPELMLGAYLFMQVGYLLTQLGLCLFTVGAFGFRSQWRWALLVGLVALCALSRTMMVLASAPRFLSGAPSQMTSFWDPAAVASFALAFGWMAAESLRYHGLLRRRLALGLADPVVTNRFFVWGAGAAATSVLILLLLGLYLQGITLMGNSLAASVLVTVSGLVMAVVPWLTFAPPGAYLRFVQRRAERSGAGRA
jgi:hypothetical protein